MLPKTADSFPHLHQPYWPWQAVLLGFSYYFNFFMWYLCQNVTTASPFSLWSANICQSDSRSSAILFSPDKPSYKARASWTLLALLCQHWARAPTQQGWSQRAGREGCNVPRSCQSTWKGKRWHISCHPSTLQVPSHPMHTRKFGSRLRKLWGRGKGKSGVLLRAEPHTSTPGAPWPAAHTVDAPQGRLKLPSVVTRSREMEQQEK